MKTTGVFAVSASVSGFVMPVIVHPDHAPATVALATGDCDQPTGDRPADEGALAVSSEVE